MSLENASPFDVLAVFIAVLSLVVSVLAMNRAKKSELFLLRQNVRIKSEMVRSAWYKLNHENESSIHRVKLNGDSPQSALMLEFLNQQAEHFELCIRDAVALAEDVHANVEKFNENKCHEYLQLIEPSLEKLARNQGVTERRIKEMMERR